MIIMIRFNLLANTKAHLFAELGLLSVTARHIYSIGWPSIRRGRAQPRVQLEVTHLPRKFSLL